MSDHVYRILYCSRNFIAGDASTQDVEIGRILATARANNHRLGVTGALLFNAGCFAQVLEGPKLAIEKVFEKIQRDERHGDVTILESGDAAQRDFPEWSMAHVHPPSEEQSANMVAALDEAKVNPQAAAGEVLDLLRTLVIQEA